MVARELNEQFLSFGVGAILISKSSQKSRSFSLAVAREDNSPGLSLR